MGFAELHLSPNNQSNNDTLLVVRHTQTNVQKIDRLTSAPIFLNSGSIYKLSVFHWSLETSLFAGSLGFVSLGLSLPSGLALIPLPLSLDYFVTSYPAHTTVPNSCRSLSFSSLLAASLARTESNSVQSSPYTSRAQSSTRTRLLLFPEPPTGIFFPRVLGHLSSSSNSNDNGSNSGGSSDSSRNSANTVVIETWLRMPLRTGRERITLITQITPILKEP